MSQETISDQLSWDEFYKNSKNLKKIKKAEPFNRLIAHSKNFYIISGYGAFTPGYVLIISKEFIPSFGLIKKNLVEELNFMIRVSQDFIKKNYNCESVIFEHGMCACIGGLDRAHLHIMSINKASNSKTLKSSIDKVLFNRKAGVKYVKFGKYKLENIHDINQIYETQEIVKKYKIIGKILKLKNLQNLSPEKWPFNTLKHISKGGHYVFFRSRYKDSSFLTKHNFQTQFGREVVFENELITNKNFKKKILELKIKNPNIVPWRWQNLIFEKNIISTIKDAKKTMGVMRLNNFYNFEVI